MTDQRPEAPRWFWIIAGLALLWNLVGVSAFIADAATGEDAIAAMDDAQRALYEARPSWLFVVYAVAVLTGLAGSIALLARRAVAAPLFAVSFGAIIVQMAYVLFAMGAIDLLGPAAAVFPAILVVIGAGLWRFSLRAKKSALIR